MKIYLMYTLVVLHSLMSRNGDKNHENFKGKTRMKSKIGVIADSLLVSKFIFDMVKQSESIITLK